MNVYDTVNKLSQEIKESDEFKNYKRYKESMKSNSEVNEEIKKFQALRYEVQISAMQGLETNKDKENRGISQESNNVRKRSVITNIDSNIYKKVKSEITNSNITINQ